MRRICDVVSARTKGTEVMPPHSPRGGSLHRANDASQCHKSRLENSKLRSGLDQAPAERKHGLIHARADPDPAFTCLHRSLLPPLLMPARRPNRSCPMPHTGPRHASPGPASPPFSPPASSPLIFSPLRFVFLPVNILHASVATGGDVFVCPLSEAPNVEPAATTQHVHPNVCTPRLRAREARRRPLRSGGRQPLLSEGKVSTLLH